MNCSTAEHWVTIVIKLHVSHEDTSCIKIWFGLVAPPKRRSEMHDKALKFMVKKNEPALSLVVNGCDRYHYAAPYHFPTACYSHAHIEFLCSAPHSFNMQPCISLLAPGPIPPPPPPPPPPRSISRSFMLNGDIMSCMAHARHMTS